MINVFKKNKTLQSLSLVLGFGVLPHTTLLAEPSAEVLDAFKTCLYCHAQYQDPSLPGEVDWQRIIESGTEIVARLQPNPAPLRPMPPSFSPVKLSQDVKNKMIEAIEAEL